MHRQLSNPQNTRFSHSSGDADVDIGALAVGVSCSYALGEGLKAAHLGLGAAAGVVSCPSFPERPTVVTRGAQGLVAGLGTRARLFTRSAVLPDRDDRRAAACDDGTVATASIVGAVRGHGVDDFVFGDLVQKVRQDRAVAFSAGGFSSLLLN